MSFKMPDNRYRVCVLDGRSQAMGIQTKGAVYSKWPLRIKKQRGIFDVIASIDTDHNGAQLEHVSISLPNRLPSWSELKYFKAQFWDSEDEVYQIIPPESQYVNIHKFCLHLWRRHDGKNIGEW